MSANNDHNTSPTDVTPLRELEAIFTAKVKEAREATRAFMQAFMDHLASPNLGGDIDADVDDGHWALQFATRPELLDTLSGPEKYELARLFIAAYTPPDETVMSILAIFVGMESSKVTQVTIQMAPPYFTVQVIKPQL